MSINRVLLVTLYLSGYALGHPAFQRRQDEDSPAVPEESEVPVPDVPEIIPDLPDVDPELPVIVVPEPGEEEPAEPEPEEPEEPAEPEPEPEEPEEPVEPEPEPEEPASKLSHSR